MNEYKLNYKLENINERETKNLKKNVINVNCKINTSKILIDKFIKPETIAMMTYFTCKKDTNELIAWKKNPKLQYVLRKTRRIQVQV